MKQNAFENKRNEERLTVTLEKHQALKNKHKGGKPNRNVRNKPSIWEWVQWINPNPNIGNKKTRRKAQQ